jgi:hypothetical protein
VECTGATEAERCGDNACKQSTGECTAVERGTLLACQACEADSECAARLKCVDHVFGAQSFGTHCFFEQGTTGCADADVGRRPYSKPAMLTSVDGEEADYCFPITTCKAVEDATAMGVGGGKTCSTQAACGDVDVNDGYCPDSGGAMGKCSYQCEENYDCPGTGFTLCSGTGADKFCQP